MNKPLEVDAGGALNVIALMCLLQEGRISHSDYVAMTNVSMQELKDFEVIIASVKEMIMAKLRSRSN